MEVEHEAKVRECLSILQTAQGLINEAAAALCSVPGFAHEWSAADDVYEAVKNYWYKVDQRRMALKAKGSRV